MNQFTLKFAAVTAAVLLAGTGFSVLASAAENETAGDRAPVETDAIVDGEAKLSVGWAYSLLGFSSEHGWIVLGDATMKGYGTPMYALSLEKDLTVAGMEGAEVYIGPDGILRFKWAETGNEEDENGADPYDVYFRTAEEGETPKEFTLLAEHYDWDGELVETKEIGTKVQGEDVTLDAQMREEINAVGAKEYMETRQVSFHDENGDAVGTNESGTEVIRYPDTAADSVSSSTMSPDGSILTVTFGSPNYRTEVFTLGSYDPSRVVYTDSATVQKVQEALNAAGFECGTADGVSGQKTAAAINAFRAEKGLEENGLIDDELLEALGL